MVKRLAVLAGMLAVLLALAGAPAALAQAEEEVSATGVIERLAAGQDDYCNGAATHVLIDESSDLSLDLTSDAVDLDSYVGQRVTAYGEPLASPAVVGAERCPDLNVTRVEPAPGLAPDRSATLSFELTVKGNPPEGTEFLGLIPAESIGPARLTDPDGDGVFTGSRTVPRFAPGPTPPGTQPVSLPVQIAQRSGGNTEIIRDFGNVLLDGDKTFRARVNFKKGAPDPEKPIDECLALSPAPELCDGYEGGGSGSGSGSGGSGSGGSGSDDSGSGGGGKSSSSAGIKELPRTGGGLPLAGIAGALLVAGGLLARRAGR